TARRAIAALALTLAACGPGDPPSFAIGFARAELLQDALALAIYVYDGGASSCEAVTAAVPRPPSMFGPFQAPLDDRARAEGLSFALNPLPVGVYTFLVDAIGADGAVVGSGCAPSQQVADGETTRIAITIE
ncbi:hypothetical protein L6R52_25070, partial [Myxococcota bacterium]|nr:hypothetical protein [Myxococcota bacterium]